MWAANATKLVPLYFALQIVPELWSIVMLHYSLEVPILRENLNNPLAYIET